MIEECLISSHVGAIIEVSFLNVNSKMENSGLVAMIASEKTESLARMYKLFARVET